MSMLGAFLRGAAGPGLVNALNRMDRADAEAAAAKQREREREEDFAWRTEQAELNRQAQINLLKERLGGPSGSGSRSSGDGGGGGGGGVDYETEFLRRTYGITTAQAKAIQAADRAGINPLRKPVGGDGVGPQELDVEGWMTMVRGMAQAVERGASRQRSNFQQLMEGEVAAQRVAVNRRMLDGGLTMPQTAEANAAMSGEGAFSNAKANEFSGALTALGTSEQQHNLAQAGSAGRANRPDDPKATGKPPAWLAEEYKTVASEIAKAQAAGDFDPKVNQAHKDLYERALDIQGRLAAFSTGGVSDAAIKAAVEATFKGAKRGPGGTPAPGGAAAPAAAPPSKPAGMLSSAPTEPDPLQGMSFAERKQAILERERAAKERKRKILASPEMQALQQQHRAAIRAGDAVRANTIMVQIDEMLREAD